MRENQKMSRPVKIVRASLWEAADAHRLLHAYFEAIGVTQRDSPEEIDRLLTDSASGLWIAYIGEIAVGCVALRPMKALALAAECKRLYVDDRFRRMGIAGALLDAMEDHARWLGAACIYLDSKDDLEAAIELYAKRSYVPCGRYNDNPQATVFMVKALIP